MKGQLHMDEQRATRLLGSPERRIAIGDIEVRAGKGNTYKVRGYASVAESPYEVYGGPERGGWIETVKRGAFDVTLASNPDVSFLINHDGTPLARTARNGKPGTLTLRSDSTGLEAEAEVDRRDPEAAGLEVKMERNDLDQMSFGFRTTRQSWNEDYTERDLIELNLDNGDVSIVNWPANPATSMSIVSARSAVAVLREMEMAELRSELGDITPDELRGAQDRLGSLLQAMAPVPVINAPAEERTPAEEEPLEEREVITLTVSDGGSGDDMDDPDDDADDQAVSALLTAFAQALVTVGAIDTVPDELVADYDGDEDCEDEDDEQVCALLDMLSQMLVKAGVIDSVPADAPDTEGMDEDDEQIAYLTDLIGQLAARSATPEVTPETTPETTPDVTPEHIMLTVSEAREAAAPRLTLAQAQAIAAA